MRAHELLTEMHMFRVPNKDNFSPGTKARDKSFRVLSLSETNATLIARGLRHDQQGWVLFSLSSMGPRRGSACLDPWSSV